MKFFENIVATFIFLAIVSLSISGYYGTKAMKEIVNKECNSNYSFIVVALQGNNIFELCRIKNQQITIKNN